MGGTFGCIGEPLAPMPYDQFLPQLEKVIPHLTVPLLLLRPMLSIAVHVQHPTGYAYSTHTTTTTRGYQHFVVIHVVQIRPVMYLRL